MDHLVPLASGTALGSFGLTEPNAGSDAKGTKQKPLKTDKNMSSVGKSAGSQMPIMPERLLSPL